MYGVMVKLFAHKNFIVYITTFLHLQEGDRIGLMRKSSGALHYYINSMDQGVAAIATPQVIWGVVDLYGMAVKVTIVDLQEGSPEPELLHHRTNNFLRQFPNDDLEEEEAVLTTASMTGAVALPPAEQPACRARNTVEDSKSLPFFLYSMEENNVK